MGMRGGPFPLSRKKLYREKICTQDYWLEITHFVLPLVGVSFRIVDAVFFLGVASLFQHAHVATISRKTIERAVGDEGQVVCCRDSEL
ncbi:hypothetical protein K239x_35620 [Planctomycetes bacterium K23_9]|uniref:Uncharacterized protein n=1 Tax=Stieleria marina TaxID=1930275 RepID=A0A517NWQ5_9BACT|nr:hypothetical protein K239x_35620 [Planctomycetes bacterium K23_9]